MAQRVIPDTWTPAAWSHDELMDMQARLDPVRMMHYADDWLRALDAIEEVFTDLADEMARRLGESWRGGAALAAVEALRRYVFGSLEGLDRCRSVAIQMGELAHAASELRACITPPSGGDHVDERLAEALAQVRVLYSGPAVAAGNAVEEIPPPPDPRGFGSATVAVAVTWPPAADQPHAVAAQPPSVPIPAPPAIAPNTVDHDDSAPWFRPPTHDTPLPTPTHAAGLSPAPGFHDWTPSSDRPPAPASLNPVSMAGPVTPVPNAAPAAGPRAATTPVTPFLGAAYPPHAGRDDALEHQIPSFLISLDNSNELIGPLPKVAPPVLGDW